MMPPLPERDELGRMGALFLKPCSMSFVIPPLPRNTTAELLLLCKISIFPSLLLLLMPLPELLLVVITGALKWLSLSRASCWNLPMVWARGLTEEMGLESGLTGAEVW